MSRTHAVDAVLRAMPDTGAVLEAGTVTAMTGDGLDTRMTVNWKGQSITDVPALGNNATIGDQVWLLRSGKTIIALVGGDFPPPSLNLKGSVATSGDLPSGPHDHGDAWITQDTGHLWYWSTESNQFIDGGPIVTTQHDALFDVRPDQHHSQSHEHDGLDGSGTVGHGSLSGVTADQHHPQAHAHDGLDDSGIISHDDLVDVGADDHHNQAHLLYGIDHSDVDSGVSLAPRHVLAVTPGGTDFGPETRMNWRGEWIDGVFYTHDVVRDGDWLMAANKETTDKAGPLTVGDPFYPYVGSSPETSVSAKTIISGQRYTFDDSGYFGAYRMHTTTGFHYTVYAIVDPDGIRDVRQLIDFTAISDGWAENAFAPIVVGAGTVFELLIYISEPDATPTTWVGNWNYTTPNNPGTPGAGAAEQADKLLGVLKVSKTDNDGGDRAAELLALTVGDVISTASVSWVIQSVTEVGAVVEFGIAPQTQSADGVQEFTFGTVAETPIPIIEDPDYWVSNANIQGVYSNSGAAGIGYNENAYGVDIYVQRMSLSEDWDIMAITGAGGSGGGGDDGGSGTNPLPIGGAADQALVKVDSQDYNVKWAGPYLPTADYEPPTPQTYLHADLTDVTADQHHPQIHDLGSHSNVQAPSPAEGQRLTWNGTDWIPAYSASAIGFAEFPYRIDASPNPTPSPGDISGDTDSGTTNTILYINEENDDGVDISLFLDELGDGDWVNIHDPDDVAGTYIRYDVIGEGVHVGDVWQFPVSFFDRLGPIFVNNQRVRIFMRFNGPDPFSGDHDDLSNVTADQHHTRYTDAEAIAAVGGPYLPLAGGTMTGPIVVPDTTSIEFGTLSQASIRGEVNGATLILSAAGQDIMSLSSPGVSIGGTRTLIVNGDPFADASGDSMVGNRAYNDARYAAEGDLAYYLPLSGGTLTDDLLIQGNLTARNGLFGSSAATTDYELGIERLVSSIGRKFRLGFSVAVATDGYGALVHESGGVFDAALLIGGGEAKVIGDGAGRIVIERQGVAFQWRFAIGSNGSILLQSSGDGLSWTTRETWTGA